MLHFASFVCFGATIGAMLTALVAPSRAPRSPCFTRLYSVAAEAPHGAYACVSGPRYGCDDRQARIGVYRQHVLQYQFEVTDFDNQLYLVTPNGALVVRLALEERPVAWPAATPSGPVPDSAAQAVSLQLFAHGTYHSTWPLPAALPLAFPHPQGRGSYANELRHLGRRLYLDDSCLYLRRRDAVFRLHLLTHAITQLPPDAGQPYITLRMVNFGERSSPYAPLWQE